MKLKNLLYGALVLLVFGYIIYEHTTSFVKSDVYQNAKTEGYSFKIQAYFEYVESTVKNDFEVLKELLNQTNDQNPKKIIMNLKTKIEPISNDDFSILQTSWSPKYNENFAKVLQLKQKSTGFQLSVKQWEYYSVVFENYLIQFVIADVKYGGLAYIHVFDFVTLEFLSHKVNLFPIIDHFKWPLLQENPAMCFSKNYGFLKNDLAISIETKPETNENKCNFKINLKWTNMVELNLNMEASGNEDQLYDIGEIDSSKGLYLFGYKTYANSCSGKLKLKNKSIQIKQENCLAMFDHTKGAFQTRTNWIWGSGFGTNKEGRKISINFATGITNPKKCNTVFTFKIDEKMSESNPGEIIFDENDLEKGVQSKTDKSYGYDAKWHRLNFRKVYDGKVNEDFWIVKNSLKYLYGFYDGEFIDEFSNRFVFENIPGIIEISHMKW